MLDHAIVLGTHARTQIARQVRAARYRGPEAEDLRQELSLRLVEGLRGYQPRCPAAFATTVVARAKARYLRERLASKRSGRPLSLHDPSCQHLISQSDPGCDLRLDLARVLARLPRDLLEVALALATYTPAGAARQLGIDRSTVHRRMVEVRRLFTLYGLHAYVTANGGGQ